MLKRNYQEYGILKDINLNDILLPKNLIQPLNQGKIKFGIPYKVGKLYIHIFSYSQKGLNQVLTIYNRNQNSLEENIKELESKGFFCIIDLEYNYKELFNQQNDDFKDYLHPFKQNQLIKEELIKSIKVLKNKLGTLKSIKFHFGDKMKFIKSSLSSIFGKELSTISLKELANIKLLVLDSNGRDLNKDQLIKFNQLLVQIGKSPRYLELIKHYEEGLIKNRIVQELNVIKNDKYVEYIYNYFLITSYLRKEKIVFILKGSAVGSLLLYLLGIGNINPIENEIGFERFLSKGKIADIDIDIPSSKRNSIIRGLNKQFKESGKELLLILNKSSANYDKFTEHPSGLLIEDSNLIVSKIPLGKSKRKELTLRVSQLYDSSSTPVLEKYGFLKYDFLRSQVLEGLEIKSQNINLDLYNLFNNWKNIEWNSNYISQILNGNYFQLNSDFAKKLVKGLNPSCYFDLVKIIACNRPALIRLYPVDFLIKQMKKNKGIQLKDQKITNIIGSSKSGKIILFQDQVIDLLNYILPNIDYSSVIKLVKARGDDLLKYKKSFIEICSKKIENREYSEQIWNMIEKFDQYGLNKAHSSSYGLVTYLQLYVNSKLTSKEDS